MAARKFSIVKEMHGVNIERFILSLHNLMQSPDIRGKAVSHEYAQEIINSMKSLSKGQRGDIYVGVIVGFSGMYLNVFGSKLLGQLKAAKRIMSSRNDPASKVGLPEGSILEEVETTGKLPQVANGRASAVILFDMERISSNLSKGNSELPKISIKIVPDEVEVEDYMSLFSALISVASIMGGK